MPWAVAAAVAGSVITSKSQKKASKQQAKSEDKAIEQQNLAMKSQEKMFERGLEETQAFRDAGKSQLAGYQDLLTSDGRAKFLGDYYSSPEYAAMSDQASRNTLRSQSAQGGLRGGSTYQQLESIAPQLGQQAIGNQMQNMMGLINVGQGMSGQASNQANMLGQSLAQGYGNIGQGYQNQGAIQAGNTLAQGQNYSNLLGSLAGIYTGGGI